MTPNEALRDKPTREQLRARLIYWSRRNGKARPTLRAVDPPSALVSAANSENTAGG